MLLEFLKSVYVCACEWDESSSTYSNQNILSFTCKSLLPQSEHSLKYDLSPFGYPFILQDCIYSINYMSGIVTG